MTPVQALVRGMLAAGVGTVAMDALWFYRYKRGGGDSGPLEWEFSAGLDTWGNASAPGKLGKLLFEAVFRRELAPRWAPLTDNVMHWGYGVGWGGVYGILAGSLARPRAVLGVRPTSRFLARVAVGRTSCDRLAQERGRRHGERHGVSVAAFLGPPFGAVVWGTSYVILPLAGLYRPIWEYDIGTLWQDLSAHLVYGLATAASFGLLSRGATRSSRTRRRS